MLMVALSSYNEYLSMITEVYEKQTTSAKATKPLDPDIYTRKRIHTIYTSTEEPLNIKTQNSRVTPVNEGI